MADIFNSKKRSEIMSRIRSKDTLIERAAYKYLRKNKIHFQKHYRRVPGCPDIAVPSKRKAVFIDGDFWHGRDFGRRKPGLPEYWQKKISTNIERDKRNRSKLRRAGWRVLRVWEHDIEKNTDKTMARIADFLAGTD